WESYDYGETWDTANLHSSGSPILYYVENIPGFPDPSGNVPEFLEVYVCGYHNTAIYDNEGNLHWTYLQKYGIIEGIDNHFLPQAEAIWDGIGFTFDEVPEMQGIDTLSGHSVPWEIDPFGNILLYVTVGCIPGGIFNNNTQKNAINFENGWMLQMWADGTYFQLALDEIPEYLPYLEHPIIFISVSSDNGNTWSEPIELTDIFDENGEPTQFYEQITCYPYVCDQIIDLGNDWGQVTLYYLDDNTFGSLDDDGGQIVYCSIKIDFSGEAIEPDSPKISNLSLTNYPNPFASSTRISFSASAKGRSASGGKGLNNASLKIYNIKGQLVKHLSIFNNQSSIKWDGKDNNNNDVVSGIYLYKLETDNGSITRKMLLTR
nr:T9SS type A sorting domain-containing protein [Candidatus Cloacimonadota bacterium]